MIYPRWTWPIIRWFLFQLDPEVAHIFCLTLVSDEPRPIQKWRKDR